MTLPVVILRRHQPTERSASKASLPESASSTVRSAIWSRRSRRLESRPALQTRLIAVERERTEIDQETAATNADSPKPGANILARYKRFVVDLQVALTRDTIRARARLQNFGARLVEDGAELYAEYGTPLKHLLSVGGALPGRVAGTGFEPVTFGL